MGRRQAVIARSITHAILHSHSGRVSVLARIPAFFYLYWLVFTCVQEELFRSLREGVWQIGEDDYQDAFGAKDKKARLKEMGDMGFSGSTFFSTADEKFIVKSIPRHFEHSFFKNDLLVPYTEHVRKNPYSLLIRITDFLENTQHSVGTLLGLAPSHRKCSVPLLLCNPTEQADIVMENVLYGKQDDWQSYDLKPQSYFFPERDLADGIFSSEATKSKLADDFEGKIILTLDLAESLKSELEKDTRLLSDCNAVDYSLFLVRIPRSSHADPFADPDLHATPLVPPGPPSWRTGIASADGKYFYKAAILDFFWAKHTIHANLMTGLIKTYNIVDRQGPMSVTTDSPEYRKRFLNMCAKMVEVQAEAQE